MASDDINYFLKNIFPPVGPSQTEYVEAAIIFRLSCAIFVLFFQLMPRIAGETLFKRNEYLMFQKEVFLVGCNVCFRSEYTFSVCTEEEEEKNGFFFVSIIFRKIMPRSRFLFSRFTILVKTVLKKVACRKQNPKKSKNRQPPKYNFICILILLMPNIVFSRVIFSSNLE